MDVFVSMYCLMLQNINVLMRISNLEQHQIETDSKLDVVLDKMEETSAQTKTDCVMIILYSCVFTHEENDA